MLISFVGSPCSGKTTIAAFSFAKLKQMGIACEYVSEYARLYIANQMDINKKVELVDVDQSYIMNHQYQNERILSSSVKKTDGIVIADSSPINSLLYMTPLYRKEVIEESRERLSDLYGAGNLLVICSPLAELDFPNDPNRVHSYEESKDIARVLETEVFPMISTLKCGKIVLSGDIDIDKRVNIVLKRVLEMTMLS